MTLSLRTFVAVTVGLVAGLSSAVAHETKLLDLQIVHPWAHGLTTAGTTAPRDVPVYMTVFNRSIAGDRLVAASSPLAQTAELRNGEAAVAGIEMAGKTSLKMSDKGPAVVLRGVTDDLAGYESFPVWLTFEKAGRVEVAVVVEDPAVKDPSCSGSLSPSEMHAHDHSHTQ